MKKAIISLVILLFISGCKTDTPTVSTPIEKNEYGIYEDIPLKDEFSDDHRIRINSESYTGYSVGYIPIEAYEDETFMIDAFYLSLMKDGHNDIPSSMIIDEYDDSWLDDTYSYDKLVNTDGSLIDPFLILNGLKDDTVLFSEVVIDKFQNDEIVDEEILEKVYITDENAGYALGIRYKDSYIDEVLNGNLVMYGPVLKDGIVGPEFNFGRWYEVFLNEDGARLSIKLDSYLDGTLVTFDIYDGQDTKRIEMLSDVDIKDITGFSDQYEDYSFNFEPRLADDSPLRNATTIEESDLKDPKTYVHEDVLFKELYEGSFVHDEVDMPVSYFEDEVFMLEEKIFGPGLKYFGYNTHNKYLASDMYVLDYDRLWRSSDDLHYIVNNFKGDTILFTSQVYVYDKVDDDKIIKETPYTSDVYGYSGMTTLGIRYKDSYLKKVMEGELKELYHDIQDTPYDIKKATVIRRYEVAVSLEDSITFIIFDYDGKTIIECYVNNDNAVFESDVDLKALVL